MDTAKEYSLELYDKCELKNVQEKFSEVLQENLMLKQENEKLQ